jgi:hypothetical protein
MGSSHLCVVRTTATLLLLTASACGRDQDKESTHDSIPGPEATDVGDAKCLITEPFARISLRFGYRACFSELLGTAPQAEPPTRLSKTIRHRETSGAAPAGQRERSR